MGGKAIKKDKVSRFDLDTYQNVKSDIINKFSQYCDIDFPIDIPNKQTFGDLDVLYKSLNTSNNIHDLIKTIYEPKDIVTNGDVISFAYQIESEYYQVDFIKCKNISMDKFYFSYGDLGSIIGRITKYYGWTFGADGLWINVYSNTVNKFLNLNPNSNNVFTQTTTTWDFGSIDLSANPEIICKFLDLDYDKWTIGFDSKNQIFDWVKKSKYFSPDIFKSLNCDHRKRALIRPFYQEFVISIFGQVEFLKAYDSEININLQLESLEYFGKINQLQILIDKHNKNKELREKFNGNLLLELKIVEKKEDLGIWIKNFKLSIQTKYSIEFDKWLESNSKEKIINEIIDYNII